MHNPHAYPSLATSSQFLHPAPGSKSKPGQISMGLSTEDTAGRKKVVVSMEKTAKEPRREPRILYSSREQLPMAPGLEIFVLAI